MTDHTLRRLERAWRETGAPADERAFRLAEVRAGVRTRDSLRDLAVLQLGLVVSDRSGLAALVEADPLLQHLALRRTERLFGPSEAYLWNTIELLRAQQAVSRASVRPAVAVRWVIHGALDLTVRVPAGAGNRRLRGLCRVQGSPAPGVQVEAEAVGLAEGLVQAVGDGVGKILDYHGQLLCNGVRVDLHQLSPRRAARQSELSYVGHHLGWKIVANMVEAQVPWVRVQSQGEWRLARAMFRRVRWEFLEWRPVSGGADPGRRG